MSEYIAYVDPFPGGHHADFLAFFLSVFARQGLRVEAMVPGQTWAQAEKLPGARSEHSLAADLDLTAASTGKMLKFFRALDGRYAANRPKFVFFPMVDQFVPALAARRTMGRRLPPWSGIFFRDSFNYSADEHGLPKLKSIAKVNLLRLALSQDALGLFTLNPSWKAAMPVPVTWLPDALSSIDRSALETRNEIGWPVPVSPPRRPGNLRLLFFGAIAPRKGLLALCDGLLSLDASELGRIELSICGKYLDSTHKVVAEERIGALISRGLTVIVREGYLSAGDLEAEIIACDAVAAPYLNHIGSSGVVGLAAQYGRPLICQGSYQVGEEVRKYDLGHAVDPYSLAEVAAAVRDLLYRGATASAGMNSMMKARNSDTAASVADAAIGLMIGRLAER